MMMMMIIIIKPVVSDGSVLVGEERMMSVSAGNLEYGNEVADSGYPIIINYYYYYSIIKIINDDNKMKKIIDRR